MDDRERERIALDALVGEATSLGEAVNSMLFPHDRVFGLGVAVFVGGLTLGLAEDQRAVLVALPFILVLFYGFALQVNLEMLSRAGHKKFIEEEINRRLGDAIFLEEQFVAPTRHGRTRFGRLSIVLYQSMLFIVVIVAAIVGDDAAKTFERDWVLPVYRGAIILSVVMLVAAVVEMGKAYQKAYVKAKAAGDLIEDRARWPRTPFMRGVQRFER